AAADLFVLHGEEMLSLFPDTEHSRTGKTTEALPKIWSDWEGFSDAVDEFIAVSLSLQQATAGTDDQKVLRKAFMQASKSCSSCHKAYRKPKR
ncbi:MAG: cytochrome c, partial [Pseudomonadota bacterium]